MILRGNNNQTCRSGSGHRKNGSTHLVHAYAWVTHTTRDLVHVPIGVVDMVDLLITSVYNKGDFKMYHSLHSMN